MTGLRLDIVQSWTPAEREFVRRRMPKTWELLSHAVEAAAQQEKEHREREARQRLCRVRAKRLWLMPFRLDRHRIVCDRRKDIACGALKPPLMVPFGEIIDIVSRVSGVAPAVIRAGGRQPQISAARMVVCWLAYSHIRLGFSEIGRAFNIDHSTAWNAVWRVRSVMNGDGNKFTRHRDQALLQILQRAEALLR